MIFFKIFCSSTILHPTNVLEGLFSLYLYFYETEGLSFSTNTCRFKMSFNTCHTLMWCEIFNVQTILKVFLKFFWKMTYRCKRASKGILGTENDRGRLKIHGMKWYVEKVSHLNWESSKESQGIEENSAISCIRSKFKLGP